MVADRIERVADDDVDGIQEWVRWTDDQDARGVGAVQVDLAGQWSWQVHVWAAEFVREEPLEGDLRNRVAKAIASVAGVTDVAEEDREVWIVSGDPSGEDLVHAVGEAVDQLASRLRAHIDGLLNGEGS